MKPLLRRAAPLAIATALLATAAAALHAQAGSTDKSAAARADKASIERGRYLSRIAGCND